MITLKKSCQSWKTHLIVMFLFCQRLVQRFVLSTWRAVCGPSAAAVGSRGSCCHIKSICHEFRKFTKCSSWHTQFLFYYQLIYMAWFVIKIFSCVFKWHAGWTPFTPNLYNIPHCYYLMLGSIPFHVFLWFLFNERHWFVPINCSLVTMKMSWRVFAMVSRLETRPSCSFW